MPELDDLVTKAKDKLEDLADEDLNQVIYDLHFVVAGAFAVAALWALRREWNMLFPPTWYVNLQRARRTARKATRSG